MTTRGFAGVAAAGIAAGGLFIATGCGSGSPASPPSPASSLPNGPLTETAPGVVGIRHDGNYCPTTIPTFQNRGAGPITVTVQFVPPNLGCGLTVDFFCQPPASCRANPLMTGPGPTLSATGDATGPGTLTVVLYSAGPCSQVPVPTSPPYCPGPTDRVAFVPYTATVTHP